MSSIHPAEGSSTPHAPLRRFALGVAALLVVLVTLISCMGEPTAPKDGGIRRAAGLRFNTIFPAAMSQAGFAGVVTFDRVRVLLRRIDGTVALDTIVNFPANVDSITLSLNVRLSPGAPPTGEQFMVTLGYINTQNDTVFKGGKQITAVPTIAGVPEQAPVVITVVYTGPGSTASAVRISPRQLSVNAGAPFTFTAIAVDATGATIVNTPVAWASLDLARASIGDPSRGSGVALNSRGTARIVATLITGQADTVLVNVTPSASALAVVSGSGQSGTVGKATAPTLASPLVAKVTAADGLGVAGVTVNFAAATGSGSVSPSSAVTDVGGIAQTSWTLANTAGTQTATASVAGLTGSPVTFTATGAAAVATKLAFTAVPASVVAAAPFNVAVTALDAASDVVSGFSGTVALSFGASPSGATLGGTTSVAAVGGVATFTGLSIALPGNGYTLTAAATGLTGATSSAFNVTSGAPASMVVVSGGGQTAATSALLAPVTVLVKDAAGAPKAGVTVSFSVSSGGGTVTPVSANTDANGNASGTWTLGPTPGQQTLTVTSVGLPDIVVSATATTTLNQIVITQQPGVSQTAGVAVIPAIKVEIRNSANVAITTFNGSVTLAIGTNPGSSTLGGTATVNAVSGVATFSSVSLDKVGTGYTLVVSSNGSSSATSSAFNVVAGPASQLVLVSGGGQTAQPSTALAQPIVAKVTDNSGNPIAGVTVDFAVTNGGGSVVPVTVTTTTSGLASAAWTVGASGSQALSVSSTGLTGSPLTVTASIGAGPPVSTTVSPQRDTITAFTDTRNLVAQGRDAAGNLVGGTWTWVSRTPSVATVSASGLVTSVANGTTIIVATEAGGSKDSATIVVQQRIATINVNPPTRSIYTGGLFTFTAQAVDGRNVPMTTQPTFTWSSTQTNVATVNATTGVATGVTIGSTQIRATSGSTVGVSNLTVLTPITRIDVTFDSTNAPAPDVFTMTSLGDRRMYRAIARDTLLNVMSGITFTWNSTNASVAIIDSTTTTKARATAAANGVTAIQAAAQGVTGAATLNVAQVLNSIDLSPTTATVAVTGTTSMIARGKDANGRFISGGSFAYNSSTPSVATINSTTGLVTGVANGSTNITATSGSITSNTAVVTVNNSGPSVISFGRDTIGIGRGSTASIPILLSKPNAANVVVNLAVQDTIAFWSASSVTIPAGQTSINATLNGRNAGTTRIFAVDGSTTGYAGDTAVLAVQANLRMTTSGYSLSATDQIITQVLLSDPSPAGGTYVTFIYGTPGRASVSPDPAFIPQGQLAADVVITGVSAGNTTLTPTASGVTGQTANISVGAAVLNIAQNTILLGQGQYETNTYVAVPNYLNSPLNITLTSTDSTIATVPPTTTIPAGNYVSYFTTNASGKGTARIISSAAGWKPDTMVVIATTPRLRLCCTTTMNTTSGSQAVTVYSADSTYNTHPRISSLTVRMSSSDNTVLKVIDTLFTIAAGSSYNQPSIAPGGAGGTAWLKVTAGGHTPDSVKVTVNAPALQFSTARSIIGVGQEEANTYVYIPNATGSPVVVTLTVSDSNKVGVPQTVTIPGNSYYGYYLSRGKALGTVSIIATAPGYSPDTLSYTVSSPVLTLQGGGSLPAYSTSSTQAYVRDTINSVHNRTTPLIVRLASTDTTVLKVDSIGTIAAGTYYLSTAAAITAVNPGTAKIIATATGHKPDTTTWTVTPAKLNFSFTTYQLGARQHRLPTEFYVYLPTSRTTPVPVTLTQKQASKVGLSATTVTIPANQSYEYFTFSGLATGRDTIIASAPGYTPDTAFVLVSSPKLRHSGFPSTATTTNPPAQITVYAADSSGGFHYTSDTVYVRAVSSDTNVVKVGQAIFPILKNDYYANTTISYVGVGTATVTYSDTASGYVGVTTNSVTVTGPSLLIAGGNGVLGMRQHTTPNQQYYVYTPNNVSTPVTVNLLSTDPRVATVPASVTIPANSYYGYFTITALDTIGTIQIQATATGYAATSVNMQVTIPKFSISTSTNLNTTSAPSTITVYAMDANGSVHNVNQDVVVTLASSATSVATIDSSVVTIQANTYYTQAAKWTPGIPGTAQLTASDQRAVFYKYNSGTANVSVVTPTAFLSFSTRPLGLGQYVDEYVGVPDVPKNPLTVSLGHASVPRTNTPSSVVIPTSTYYEYFRISGTSAGLDTITASPPGHNSARGFVSVALGRIDPISGWPASLQAGDSTLVTLYARDVNQTVHYVSAATTFTLAPNANIQFKSGGAVITSVTIPADAQYVQFYIKGAATGTGSATITNSNYATYTNSVTITP